MITDAAKLGVYRHWSEPELARLAEVRARRLTRRQLAAELGRSFKAVKWALSPTRERP